MLTAVEQKITPSVFTALRLALIIRCQQSNSRICLLVTSSKGFFCLVQRETGLQLKRPKPTDYMSWLSTARGQRMVNHVQTPGAHDPSENSCILELKKKKLTCNFFLRRYPLWKMCIFNTFQGQLVLCRIHDRQIRLNMRESWLYSNQVNVKRGHLSNKNTITHLHKGFEFLLKKKIMQKNLQISVYFWSLLFRNSIICKVPVREAGLIERMDGEVDRRHPGLELRRDGGPSAGSTPPVGCARGSWLFFFRHFSRDSRRRSSFWEDSCTRDWAWREDKHCVVMFGLLNTVLFGILRYG